MFRLTRYFSVTSFIAFVIVSIILGVFYRQYAITNLLVMAENNNAALTQTFANSLWPEFAPFVGRASQINVDELADQPEIAQMRQAVLGQTANLSILKIKVYNLEALTVFSTEAAQIGQDKSDNAGYLAARNGQIATELTHRDTFSAFEGMIEDRDVISSYVPIRVNGRVEGVFEVYDDVTPLLAHIQTTQLIIGGGVVVILTALWIILFLIVRRGDHIIQQQRQEREQAQVALRASEEKYRILVEKMNEGVLQLNQHNAVEYVNNRFCQMVGYTREQLIGRIITDILPRQGDEVSGQFEFQMKKKWGEPIWMLVSSAPITNARGQLSGTVEVHTDITEHKRSEEVLRQARDEALEALRFKAQILANVSHDARTPLSVITLHSEMLQRGIYGQISDKQKNVIDGILVSTRQLLFFVNSLLDEAQLNSGKLVLRNTHFRPEYLLKTVAENMQPLANRKSLELHAEIGANLPDTLNGDPDRLNQILYNLIDNAIKYTSSGTISINLHRHDVEHWAMQVSDTGMGIDPEAQNRIFESFWQVDGSNTRKIMSGVGLGLSIVKQLTELMGGRIEVQSDPGSGSTFTVLLPVQMN